MDAYVPGLLRLLSGDGEGDSWLCANGGPLWPLDFMHWLLFPVQRGTLSQPPPNCCRVALMQHPPEWLDSSLWDASGRGTFTGDELYDALACLVIASVAVALGIVLLRMVWHAADPAFAAITPSHKQLYVVANVVKAGMLGAMVLSWRWWTANYEAFANDAFLSVPMKRTSVLYIATDVVALAIVPKLPTTTKVHHYVATLLVLFVCATDATTPGFGGTLGVAKMIVVLQRDSNSQSLDPAHTALPVECEFAPRCRCMATSPPCRSWSTRSSRGAWSPRTAPRHSIA